MAAGREGEGVGQREGGVELELGPDNLSHHPLGHQVLAEGLHGPQHEQLREGEVLPVDLLQPVQAPQAQLHQDHYLRDLTLSRAYPDAVLFPFSSKDLKYFSTSDLV